MTPDERALRALKAYAKGRPRASLVEAFALIRKTPDAQLLRLLGVDKPEPAPRKRAADPLIAEVTAILAPILGPAAEKAELLMEHMAEAEGQSRPDLLEEPGPKGLADGVRRLRKRFSDEEIRAGAHGLIARLARTHSMRETVV